MRLTPVLCKFRSTFVGNQIKYRGSALSGKHRFVPPVTRGDRYMLWNDWRNEIQGMKYLAHPYVTQDEELDYLESIGERYQDVDPLYTSTIEPPMRQRYAIEILEKFERNRQHEHWD